MECASAGSSLLGLALDLPQTSQRRLTLLKFVEVVGDVGDGIDQHDQPRQVAAQPGDTQITVWIRQAPRTSTANRPTTSMMPTTGCWSATRL